MIPWINMGDCEFRIDVREYERLYAEKSGGRVHYIGDLSISQAAGQHSDSAYPIFWQEKLIDPSHTHYFGLTYNRFSHQMMIFDGSSAVEGYRYGMMHPTTGEVVFSRAGWDMRKTQDGSISVDGGRGRMRIIGQGIPVRMKFIDYRMVITDVGDWPKEDA